MTDALELLRYPIGRFIAPETYTEAGTKSWIAIIEILPSWLDSLIENLDEAHLQTAYRPGGWTVQQVIHHMADSHMNAFVRVKLALTEDVPTVKPYDEQKWAETAEIETVPVNVSITLLHALHRRWAALLRSFTAAEWERTYFHPESGEQVPLWRITAMYAWHCRHHMEQVRSLRNRSGW